MFTNFLTLQICVGVSKKENDNDEHIVNSKFKKRRTNLRLYFVDFNDTGKLEHFLARLSTSNMFDTDTNTMLRNNPFSWQSKDRLDVVCLKQLDRETLFLAYEDKVNSDFIVLIYF